MKMNKHRHTTNIIDQNDREAYGMTRPARHAVLFTITCVLGIGAGFAQTDRQAFAAEPGQQDTVRPAVGRPLRQAQALMAAQKYTAALVKIRQADAVRNKTRYEAFVVEELRGFAEKGAGDSAAAIKSFETVIADGRLSKADRARFAEEIAVEYYDIRDYPNAIQWAARYLEEGGDAAEIHTLLAQSYYLTGDFADAARQLQSEVNAALRANHSPTESQLAMLADCALKENDQSAYAAHLEQLVLFYPKKQYWLSLLHQVESSPDFADRLHLDLDRLKLATGTLASPDDYLGMTELALADGLPGEARNTLERGYAAGILGTGPGAERQNRLRNLVAKSITADQGKLAQNLAQASQQRDGADLVNIGQDYISYGQTDKGIALVEAGIGKGGLLHPEDARLRLGVAYLVASEKAKALQVLGTVHGTDGAGELARLWTIYARQPENVVTPASGSSATAARYQR